MSNPIIIDRAETTTEIVAYTGVDLSTFTMTFVVRGFPVLTLPLIPNPDDHTQRLLTFTPDYAASLGSKERDAYFRVVHSDGAVEALRCSIVATGWIA